MGSTSSLDSEPTSWPVDQSVVEMTPRDFQSWVIEGDSTSSQCSETLMLKLHKQSGYFGWDAVRKLKSSKQSNWEFMRRESCPLVPSCSSSLSSPLPQFQPLHGDSKRKLPSQTLPIFQTHRNHEINEIMVTALCHQVLGGLSCRNRCLEHKELEQEI